MVMRNLSHEPDLKCWNKDKLRRSIFKDPRIEDVVHIDNKYEVVPTMIAMYNFQEKPLAGLYQTVIFDRDKGIILTTKNSRQLMNQFVRTKSLNFSHSRLIQEKLAIHERHALCLGNYSYFSIQGYSKQTADWVSLHQVTQMELIHDQSSFICDLGLIFHFEKDYLALKRNVIQSLSANRVVLNDAENLGKELGYKLIVQKSLVNSLVHNANYRNEALEIKGLEKLVLPSLWDDQEFKTLQKFFREEFNLFVRPSDWMVYKEEIKEKQYLW